MALDDRGNSDTGIDRVTVIGRLGVLTGVGKVDV